MCACVCVYFVGWSLKFIRFHKWLHKWPAHHRRTKFPVLLLNSWWNSQCLSRSYSTIPSRFSGGIRWISRYLGILCLARSKASSLTICDTARVRSVSCCPSTASMRRICFARRGLVKWSLSSSCSWDGENMGKQKRRSNENLAKKLRELIL